MNTIKKRYEVGVNDLAHSIQLGIIKSYLEYAEEHSHITSVLDCPCGSGRFSNLFSPFQLTCGDIADHRLAKTKNNIDKEDVSYVKCDLFELPFEDNSFDFILCALVLQHIDKKVTYKVLAELSRVTRKWILLTYNKPAPLRFHRGFKKPQNAFLKDEFASMIEPQGLTISKSRSPIPLISANRFVLLSKN